MVLCHGCNKPIVGQYIEALGYQWHKEHFVCAVCHKSFEGQQFFTQDGKPYCEPDYFDLFGTKCAVCREPIKGQYYTDRWENSFCARHDAELEKCFSCRRLICQGITGGGVEYSDGRKTCSLCRKTAIDDIGAAQPLFNEVLKVLSRLGLSVDAGVKIPLRLADLDTIDKLAGGTPQTEAGISLLETMTRNGIETDRHVKEVVVLFGLPREHAAAVLAHEFGHVWCFLNHLPKLPLPEQEGICEMFAFQYLSQVDSAESRFYKSGIENNEDPIYGGGFRKIREVFGNRPLMAALKDFAQSGLT